VAAMKRIAFISLIVLCAPLFASAQAYYGTPYYGGYNNYGGYPGGYSYGYIPPTNYYPQQTMNYYPQQYAYPSYGQQQQQQQGSYGYYQYPQYYQNPQTYGGSMNYGYPAPVYGYTQAPYTASAYSGRQDAVGDPLCYYSDYPTTAVCGQDPQQWVQDPYTGTWY
jgi:hypothetical protein